MTNHKSQEMREVENDLIAYRARQVLKMPKHPGLTLREQQDHQLKVWQVLVLGMGILLVVLIAVGMVMLP